MSNRQARNIRKANRRRDKMLSHDWSVPGFSAAAQLTDFGRQLVVSMARLSDGHRCGINYQPRPRWRRAEREVPWITRKLLSWFERNPDLESYRG